MVELNLLQKVQETGNISILRFKGDLGGKTRIGISRKSRFYQTCL